MVALRSADDLFVMKASQRTDANTVRAKEHEMYGDVAGNKLAEIGLGFVDIAPGTVVSGYFPYRSEIDVMPLLERLHHESMQLALPVVVEKQSPLVFRLWAPGEPLQASNLNILEPAASSDEVDPDILLVPLLAFDNAGYRLGYGGGFYDRTLEKLRRIKRITAIAVAYAGQQVDAVARGDNDQPVDWILTEHGPRRREPK